MGKRGPKQKYPAFIACAVPVKLAAGLKTYAQDNKITVSEAIRRLIRVGIDGEAPQRQRY